MVVNVGAVKFSKPPKLSGKRIAFLKSERSKAMKTKTNLKAGRRQK